MTGNVIYLPAHKKPKSNKKWVWFDDTFVMAFVLGALNLTMPVIGLVGYFIFGRPVEGLILLLMWGVPFGLILCAPSIYWARFDPKRFEIAEKMSRLSAFPSCCK
jgi:uncharacterized membrane-anchored protein